MAPPIDYLFIWLEMNGFLRIKKWIRNIMMSYMVFVTGGLALAATLNGLALFIELVLIPNARH
jgi:hypothetical protein